jgi:predicted alpha/beta superfamily hydrolase
MKKALFYLTISILAIGCKSKINDPIPRHDSLTIFSKYVNENRILNIWTPETYNDSDDKFPVLYMADGGIKEDFPHIANTLAKLIKKNKIPPHILVGIENTERHRDLTSPTKVEHDLKYLKSTGGSEKFRDFIKKELFNEIQKKYRTTNEKTIIGESLAGLFVVETFLLDNDMFDNYIAMDPSLWFNEQYLVKNFESLSKKDYQQKNKIWFAGSSVVDISLNTRALNEKLKHTDKKLIWKYSDEPKEKHNTIFRATKEKALIWTLNKDK